ncbi:MAG: choice-of-anchor Q domain-containing protein [Planctomycetota bacterium]
MHIANSILWNDRTGPGTLSEIADDSIGGITVEYSDVGPGGWPGNLNTDPLFCNPSVDGYHLSANSPCIDVGDNSQVVIGSFDLDGNPRIVDGPDAGTVATVDLGCYEYQYNYDAGCNMGGLAQACPPSCKTGAIDSSTPASGTRDARQPHPEGTSGVAAPLSQRQGIGSPNTFAGYANSPEIVSVTLKNAGVLVPGASSLACWSLCETGKEQVESPTPELNANRVISVAETVPGSSGVYQILLDRPISGAHWTAISYLGGSSSVSYASLPADVNRDGYAGPSDILDLVDCCLNLAGCDWHLDLLRCDIDHSGVVAPADQLTLTDLLNGAGNFIVWNGKTLPTNTCAGAGLMALGSSQPVSAEEENRAFADWFVNYLTMANPADSSAEDDFRTIVDSLTQWCVDHFTAAERTALAERLSDPALTFVSQIAQDMVLAIVETLRP